MGIHPIFIALPYNGNMSIYIYSEAIPDLEALQTNSFVISGRFGWNVSSTGFPFQIQVEERAKESLALDNEMLMIEDKSKEIKRYVWCLKWF